MDILMVNGHKLEPVSYANKQDILDYKNNYLVTESKTVQNTIALYTQDQVDRVLKEFESKIKCREVVMQVFTIKISDYAKEITTLRQQLAEQPNVDVLVEALRKLEKYPSTRNDEMSAMTMRKIANEALNAYQAKLLPKEE